MEIFPCFVKAVIKNVDFRKELGIFPTVSYPAASLSFERNILSFAMRFTPKINYPILRDNCQWQNQCIQQSLPFDILLLNKMLSCRIQLMYCFLATPTKDRYISKKLSKSPGLNTAISSTDILHKMFELTNQEKIEHQRFCEKYPMCLICKSTGFYLIGVLVTNGLTCQYLLRGCYTCVRFTSF